jgi:hypothetical protein
MYKILTLRKQLQNMESKEKSEHEVENIDNTYQK